MNYMGIGTWPRCRRARARATSSTTTKSSQRYIPYYSAICREAQRKAPAQRRRAVILRRALSSRPGVDYRARKSALIAEHGATLDPAEGCIFLIGMNIS